MNANENERFGRRVFNALVYLVTGYICVYFQFYGTLEFGGSHWYFSASDEFLIRVTTLFALGLVCGLGALRQGYELYALGKSLRFLGAGYFLMFLNCVYAHFFLKFVVRELLRH